MHLARRHQSRIRKEPVMEKGTTFVGLDVHKDAINVAMLLLGETRPVEWQVSNDPAAVRRLVRKLQRSAVGEVRVCYEAGSCGYAVQRTGGAALSNVFLTLGVSSRANARSCVMKHWPTPQVPQKGISASEPTLPLDLTRASGTPSAKTSERIRRSCR